VTIPAVAFTTTSSLVVLRYSNSDGTVIPTDQDSLDAVVDGGKLDFTTARGISPSEIILDGGGQATRHITGMMDDGFLNPINSYAPEECVPGQIQESVGISVYTQPGSNSPVISTKHYWYDGNQLTYKLGIKPNSVDSVIVVYNKVKLSQYWGVPAPTPVGLAKVVRLVLSPSAYAEAPPVMVISVAVGTPGLILIPPAPTRERLPVRALRSDTPDPPPPPPTTFHAPGLTEGSLLILSLRAV
jgi:hypothetical protein